MVLPTIDKRTGGVIQRAEEEKEATEVRGAKEKAARD